MLNKLLDRTISVTMVLLVFVVLGCISIVRLPVSLIPEVDAPTVSVQITASDYSARELDDVVVKPLRRSLVQMNHLKELHAESKDGSAVLTLTFDEGQDTEFLYIEVNEKVDRAMSSLPDIDRPKVFKASATDIPSFYINVILDGEETPGHYVERLRDSVLFPVKDEFLELSDFVRDILSKRIELLEEVAMVDFSGVVDREVLLIPDEDKLHRLSLTLSDFEKYVSASDVSLSNLTIRDGEYHYNVKFRSFASSVEDIGNIYFKVGGRLMQIKDVAEVIEHPSKRTGLALSDGEDAVVLAIIKQNEAKMSDLKRVVSEQIDIFEKDYPQLKFTLTRDQTELLQYSINNLILNIVIAVILVCLIIFLFMRDFRSPMLVALTIPISLVVSFCFFYIVGITVNIISLSGLILGVGMMVDNSIVLVDNITARWVRGEALRESVVNGTKEVAGAMLSSVLTTCAVFIPLVFLNGLAGELFFDQAVAVSVVLLTAYIVTIVVLPVYYWAVYKKFDHFTPNKILSRFQFTSFTQFYDKTVSWCLSNKWISIAFPLVSVALIVLCAGTMKKEKLPPVTYTDTMLNIDWNEHITIDENRKRMLFLGDAVKDLSSQNTAYIGVQQFVLGHSEDQSVNEASFYFKCESSSDLSALKTRLSSLISETYPEAVCGFSNSGNIFEMVFGERNAELTSRLRPTSDEGLKVSDVREFISELGEKIPEIKIDEIPLKTDVVYVSDPELMTLYGVGFSDLTSVLENSLNGNTVFEIVRSNRSVPVVIGTNVREMDDILSATFIDKGEDGMIPAGVLMRQTYEEDFKQMISGEDGNYYPVSFDVNADKVPSLMQTIQKTAYDSGKFDVSFSGAYFSNIELVKQMLMVLLVAIAMLFLILASQFESLLQPLIILSEIVIDISLSLLTLLLLGDSINIMSLIGLVVVSGIVINDSILKIDTINRLVKVGMEIEAAVHEAGHRRLNAIVMTSLTTILSVAPFLSRGNMGADLQYPMAVVITVGMTVGTLVSLFYVPTLYSLVYNRRRH